jgi:hypothetical protein
MRIAELCRSKLDQHVEQVFQLGRIQAMMAGEDYGIVPYIEDSFPIHCEPLFPHFKRMMIAALSARWLFEKQKPDWAPQLPLCSDDIDKLLRNEDDPRLNLVGYFASSWACMNWDKRHPQFFVYASGVMACPHAPEHIRTDRRLRREFPPTLLTELDHTLCWNTVERTIEFAQQLMRQEEHLYRCGMPADAERMQVVIKHLTGVELVYPD